MEYNIICLPSWWREGEEGVSKLGYPPIKIVWLELILSMSIDAIFNYHPESQLVHIGY